MYAFHLNSQTYDRNGDLYILLNTVVQMGLHRKLSLKN